VAHVSQRADQLLGHLGVNFTVINLKVFQILGIPLVQQTFDSINGPLTNLVSADRHSLNLLVARHGVDDLADLLIRHVVVVELDDVDVFIEMSCCDCECIHLPSCQNDLLDF